jgi:hypothetical protein
MKITIKNQSTIFGDKIINAKEGVYKYTTKSSIAREEGPYYFDYETFYVEVDNGCLEVIVGDQVFELQTGRDGHIGVCPMKNEAGEIVGLFV